MDRFSVSTASGLLSAQDLAAQPDRSGRMADGRLFL